MRCKLTSLNIYFVKFGTIRSKIRPEVYLPKNIATEEAEEYYEAPADYDIDNANSQTFGTEYNIMTSAVNVSLQDKREFDEFEQEC